jgi:hypothetical protein
MGALWASLPHRFKIPPVQGEEIVPFYEFGFPPGMTQPECSTKQREVMIFGRGGAWENPLRPENNRENPSEPAKNPTGVGLGPDGLDLTT